MNKETWAKIQAKVAECERIAETEGLYHRGHRFWPPYACFTCGEPISAYQFAFARVCGPCDVGNSSTARLLGFREIFLSGKAVLENPHDTALIHPEFIPAHRRREFPVRYRRPIPRKPAPSPWLPKPRPKPLFRAGR